MKPVLIGGVGLLVAVALGILVGSSDFLPLIVVALAFGGITFWFGSGQWFWPIAIASSYLAGTFPALGGSFTPFQILMAIGIVKFLVEEAILRRRSLARVEWPLLIALAGFMLIITWHGIRDRFGMRFLGSNVWGGRNYVNVFVGLIAFFVVQSTSVKTKFWNKLPYLVLAVTSFDLVIAAVTTIFPATITRIYPFYSAVGVAGVTDLLTGHEDVTDRIVNFGNFGYILIAIILAATPVWRLFQLKSLGRLLAAGLASLIVLYSGFRSALANILLTFLVAGYRDFRFKILFFVPVMVAVLLGVSAINSSIVRLPKQMQRALVFLPGDWDAAMVGDAHASNEFRARVWTIWWREYFPEQPIWGRGFGFRKEWTQEDVLDPKGVDIKQMVEVGNIHNGLFASLDAVGIVGTVFFIAWNVILLWRAVHVPFDKMNPAGFALRFLALQLAVSILCFWGGAVTLGTFLPQQFALAGVFLKLSRETKHDYSDIPASPLPELPEQPQLVGHV